MKCSLSRATLPTHVSQPVSVKLAGERTLVSAVASRDRRSGAHLFAISDVKAVAPAPCALALTPLARPAAQRAGVVAKAGETPATLVEWHATGVPLVDDLAALGSVEAAAVQSAKLIAAVLLAVIVGRGVLMAIDKAVGGRLDAGSFNIVGAAVASTLDPGEMLLPFFGLAYVVKVLSALAQVAAVKMKHEFAQLCMGRDREVLSLIKKTTQFFQDTSELVVIVGLVWIAIGFKDRVIRYIQGNLHAPGVNNEGLNRILTPLGQASSFGIALIGFSCALSAYGLNVRPLLASVGGAGVIVGLAAQNLLRNATAAFMLYTSPPFISGDQVCFMTSSGATVIKGLVLQVEPMRTTLRTEDNCIAYVNNSDIQNFIIKNLRQLH